MADVAAAAGVSVGTVSNVLHRPDIVTRRTREKVHRAMRDLRYTYTPQATQQPSSKQGVRPSRPILAPSTEDKGSGRRSGKPTAHINPYFTPAQAAQVRAAFQAVGLREGYASLSDLVVAATLEEVNRLQRKYNDGQNWQAVPAGMIRRGRPTRGERGPGELPRGNPLATSAGDGYPCPRTTFSA
ncbi:LacI family DNA-binding transcriptional regulator [Arthrobacter sp. NQ7]|uniref:ParB family protein n=1 Tax=Arthrobacter sp. NQ7 TaxID=3032303 RepID=UPI0032D932B3